MSATLVLIDFQKAADDPSFSPRGQMQAEENAMTLLAHWREMGQPVVHLQNHAMDPDAPDAPGAEGHAFKKGLAPLSHEPVVEKRTDNGFVGTDLMAVLEDAGPAELVMCGLMLEGAVESTIRMAHALGFMVFIPHDCTASRAQRGVDGQNWTVDQVHGLTLSILDGEYGKVVSSQDLMTGATGTKLH
ncbi:MAG: isochorismatase family protein [Pseudomonadota bacterium]